MLDNNASQRPASSRWVLVGNLSPCLCYHHPKRTGYHPRMGILSSPSTIDYFTVLDYLHSTVLIASGIGSDGYRGSRPVIIQIHCNDRPASFPSFRARDLTSACNFTVFVLNARLPPGSASSTAVAPFSRTPRKRPDKRATSPTSRPRDL